jgi:flagellar biosynthesis/type III secretory pathway chaperone
MLEKILGENPDSTTGQLARLANADRGQVLTLLKELEAADRARRSGQRAATRWRRFTDEDAIAERAAELSNLTKKQQQPQSARLRPRPV